MRLLIIEVPLHIFQDAARARERREKHAGRLGGEAGKLAKNALKTRGFKYVTREGDFFVKVLTDIIFVHAYLVMYDSG